VGAIVEDDEHAHKERRGEDRQGNRQRKRDAKRRVDRGGQYEVGTAEVVTANTPRPVLGVAKGASASRHGGRDGPEVIVLRVIVSAKSTTDGTHHAPTTVEVRQPAAAGQDTAAHDRTRVT